MSSITLLLIRSLHFSFHFIFFENILVKDNYKNNFIVFVIIRLYLYIKIPNYYKYVKQTMKINANMRTSDKQYNDMK